MCVAHQNLRTENMGSIPSHNSYGVISTDYDGALFSVKAVLVLKHNLQNIMAVSFYYIIDLTKSNKVRLRLLDTPLLLVVFREAQVVE